MIFLLSSDRTPNGLKMGQCFREYLSSQYNCTPVDLLDERVRGDLEVAFNARTVKEYLYFHQDPSREAKVMKALYGPSFELKRQPLVYQISGEEVIVELCPALALSNTCSVC